MITPDGVNGDADVPADADADAAADDIVQAAHDVLAAHPDARVVAISDIGTFVAMPQTVPLSAGHHVIKGHTTALEFVVTDELMAVADAWRNARDYGRAVVDVHPLAAPETTMTMHFFDTRCAYGVLLGVLTGEGAEHISDARGERDVLRPRLVIARQDRDGVYLEVDDVMETVLGHTGLVGTPAIDLVHPDEVARVIAVWLDMLARPGGSQRIRNRIRHLDGRWVWFEVTFRNLLDEPSEGAVVVEMIDISDEMAAHEFVVAQETLLRRLTDSLPVGVVQVDSHGLIVHRNPQADQLFGHPEATTIEELLVNVAPADAAALTQATRAALDDVDSDLEINVHRDSEVRRYQVTLRGLPDAAGVPSGFIVCISDVTEPARLRDQLRYRATFDVLTGCHNRASVLHELDRALADGSRGTAVTFIDLDGFKLVNDRRGHAAGDALLRDIGHCLQDCVRANDVVGRFGGDEFVLVHPDTGSAEQALELADRVAAALAASFRPEDPHPAVASVGAAWVPGALAGSTDADTVTTWADTAMYHSKARGDGRPVLFDNAMAAQAPTPAPV